MTQKGGLYNDGTIFSVNTDGGNFQLLYSFTGSDTDGAYPWRSLTVSGSKLYGTTSGTPYGGTSINDGTIFSINTDGTDFQNLHSFNGIDGASPRGDLTLVGSTLYGMTYFGGDSNDGVIFALTVPEPSTLVLFGIAAVGLLLYGWWRQRWLLLA